MPEDAHRGRADPLTATDRVQLLTSEFAIDTDSPDVRRRINEVAPFPHQDVEIRHRRTLRAHAADGEFHIASGPVVEDFELTAFYAAENLLRRMRREALAALADHIQLRAAIGRHADRTFLLVGPRRSGKTTLALRLLLDGSTVSGDDLVLLRHGEAVAFPWRFMVNEASVPLLPRLRELPQVKARNGATARDWWHAVDPTELGGAWHIAPATVSAVFFLEPNHGARSVVSEIGKLDMTRRLLAQATAPPSGRRGWIGEIARMCDQADSCVVQLGDLESAAVAIRKRL